MNRVESSKPISESRRPDRTVTVSAMDPEGTIEKLAKAIQNSGNAGHSFEIIVDPDYSEADGGNIKFYWDGDGSDYICDVRVVQAGDYKSGDRSARETVVEIDADDEEGTLEKLFKTIGEVGGRGHGFSIAVDPLDKDIVGENPNHKDGPSFYWDGDGSDRINDVQSKKIISEKRRKKKSSKKKRHGFGAYTTTYYEPISGGEASGDGGMAEAEQINEDWVDDLNRRGVSTSSLGGEKYGGERVAPIGSRFGDSEFGRIVSHQSAKKEELLARLDPFNAFYKYTETFKDKEQYKKDMIELIVLVGTLGHQVNLLSSSDNTEEAQTVRKDWESLKNTVNDFKHRGGMSEQEFQTCTREAEPRLVEIGTRIKTAFDTMNNQGQQPKTEEENATTLADIHNAISGLGDKAVKVFNALVASYEATRKGDSKLANSKRDEAENYGASIDLFGRCRHLANLAVQIKYGESKAHAEPKKVDTDINHDGNPDAEFDDMMEFFDRYETDYDYNDKAKVASDLLVLFTSRERMMAIKFYHQKLKEKEDMEDAAGNIQIIDVAVKDLVKQSGLSKNQVTGIKEEGQNAANDTWSRVRTELGIEPQSTPASGPNAALMKMLVNYFSDLHMFKTAKLSSDEKASLGAQLRGELKKAQDYSKRNNISKADYQKMYAKAERELQNRTKMQKESRNKKISEVNSPELEAKVGHGDGEKHITVDGHAKSYEQYIDDLKRIGGKANSGEWKEIKGLYARMAAFGDMTKGEYQNYLRGMKKKIAEALIRENENFVGFTVEGRPVSFKIFKREIENTADAISPNSYELVKNNQGGLYHHYALLDGDVSGDEYEKLINKIASGITGNTSVVNEASEEENNLMNEDFILNAGGGYLVKLSQKQLVRDIFRFLTRDGGSEGEAKRAIGTNRSAVEDFYNELQGKPQIKANDYQAMIEKFISSIMGHSLVSEGEQPCTMCELAQIVDDSKLSEARIITKAINVEIKEEVEAAVVKALTEHYQTGCKICREKAVTEATKATMSKERFIMLAEFAVARSKRKVELKEASRINLKLTSNTKREMIKKAKTALDAIYAIYDVCEKQGIDAKQFVKELDKAFEGTNEMLTILVTQDSVEKK